MGKMEVPTADTTCYSFKRNEAVGTNGSIATGIFASAEGLIAGNPEQVVIQIIGVIAAVVYSFVMTFIIGKIIDVTVEWRVKEEEYVGLDVSQHGEVHIHEDGCSND